MGYVPELFQIHCIWISEATQVCQTCEKRRRHAPARRLPSLTARVITSQLNYTNQP